MLAFGKHECAAVLTSSFGDTAMSTTFTRHAETRTFTSPRGERQTARILCHVREGDADTSCWEHCMILGDFREMFKSDIAALAGIDLGYHEDPHYWNNAFIMRRTENYTLIYHAWGLSV